MKVSDDTPQSEAAGSASRGDALIGRLIDNKIRIEQVLGRGGMGSVYRAQHTALGCNVAVKVLSASFDEQALSRFYQEARVAFSLRNENICSVHDVGTTPDARAYLVMDYVEGKNLSTLIRESQGLEMERALDLAVQICNGLEAAHAQSVVHRDIKPSNILIVNQNGKESAKIIDFGIAKSSGPADANITATGQIMGSPAYMSPEQCSGHLVDARADIYSFGCVLFEMLCGKPAFTGDNAMQVFMKQMTEAPQTLSKSANKRFPSSLEDVVARCLAKDPDERYQNIASVRSDLLRVKQGQKIDLPPRAASRFGNKELVMTVIGAALLCGVVAFSLLSNRHLTQEATLGQGTKSVSVVPASNSSSGGRSGEHVATAGSKNVSDELHALQQRLDHALAIAAGPGEWARIAADFDGPLLDAKIAWGEGDPRYVGALHAYGMSLRLSNNFASAIPALEKALRLQSDPKSFGAADAAEDLAYALKGSGDDKSAAKYATVALNTRTAMEGANTLRASRLNYHIGEYLASSGDLQAAIASYEKALAIEAGLGTSDPAVKNEHAFCLGGLADCYNTLKDSKQAIANNKLSADAFIALKDWPNAIARLKLLKEQYLSVGDNAGVASAQRALADSEKLAATK